MAFATGEVPDIWDVGGTFLTEQELARRWRCSTRSLQRWRKAGGALPHVRIGKRILYRLRDVETAEAAGTAGGKR